jgi:hypothetical protein
LLVAAQACGGIALAPTIAPGRSDQLLHLALSQMLARPELGIGRIDRSTVRFSVAGDTSRSADLFIECCDRSEAAD